MIDDRNLDLKKILFFFIMFGSISGYAQNDISYYTNLAKKNSPLIKDNQNQDKVNQAEIERLKAFYTKPQVGVTANYLIAPILSKDGGNTKLELTPVSATNYYGYEFGVTNGGQYQGLVTVSQPLFNKGRYETTAEQMAVASQVNQNNVKLAEHDLDKIVIDQYILCLQDMRQINYLEQMLVFLENQKSLLNTLIDRSIYKRADGIVLDIDYHNYNGQLQAARTSYQRDLLDLNILCGINDTEVKTLKDEKLTLLPESQTGGFLKKYELDSLAATAQQNIFELKYKPLFTAFANTGLNAININNITNRFGLSAGLSLSVPIFDGEQRKITRAKTELLKNSVNAYKDNFEAQNTVRKAKILKELQSFPGRLLTMDKQLEDYDKLLQSYKKEIMLGQLTIINYSTAIRNKLTLQRDYSTLITQQQLLINTYNYWNW